jgi:hypothetical protein
VDLVIAPERKGKLHALAGIDPAGPAWAIVDEAQPYRRPIPDYSPVSLLDWFWNVDKHQTLHGRAVAVDPADVNLLFRWNPEAGEPVEDEFRLHKYEMLDAGAEVARLRFARPGPVNPEVHLEGQLALDIRFGDGTNIVKDATLSNLAEFVELLIQRAEWILEP